MNKESHHEAKSPKVEKSPIALREEETLAFWKAKEIFKKTLAKEAPKGDFVFYDGPPFATGTPHYGHLLAGTMKDAIPRYRTMQGYHVDRRWGWDCHGLPLENIIEKELGLSTKKDIEELGVEKFNEAARKAVLRYAHVWQEIVPRFGRFVDMENDYRTMDRSYTESVLWVFKTLYDKGLIYEGFKPMHLCPRCETTLSNFEVSQGYKDITDISVFVKFALVGEENTYIIAWTTTPWTLPGNVALAVNKDLVYAKVKSEGEIFYVAKENAAKTFGAKAYEVLAEVPGSALVGKSYKPLFPYYSHEKGEKFTRAWKVYEAPYVTLEKGTGIVHLAPAFGAEDMELAEKVGLPLVHHVGKNGKFVDQVKDFAGMDVKPKGVEGEKDAHQKTDVEIIKFLAAKGQLFGKEKIVHSYPHCWRCQTPLLNYAASSWFVRVTDFKDKLVEVNKSIGWTPKEIGEGRFGKWLEGARDWAISRSRYWGAPLPVWRTADGKETFVAGSLEDIKKQQKPRNRFIVMRHGEAENNVLGIVSSKAERPHHLTEKGKKQVLAAASKLKKEKIDFIVSSPFVRTQETAKLVAETLGLDKKKIKTDARLHELNGGVFDGKPIKDYRVLFGASVERFTTAPEHGETLADIQKRMLKSVYELDREHEGKTILVVTHDTPAWLLIAGLEGWSPEKAIADHNGADLYFENAEYREVCVLDLPRNRDMEIDFHRPYVDEFVLRSKNGEPMKRVPDVFDCWFESGSMPYGEAEYLGKPTEHFDPKGGWFKKTKGFPADFIGEGLDQTRGWFYSMLVLGVALFGKSPYQHVIVNGLVLAEDGKKMSKSLKNYPDPMDMVNKYGADAVRYFMLTSPVVSAEDLCFSEKGVDEVVKKVINRLDNVVSFYEMFADDTVSPLSNSTNYLDRWMLARLGETVQEVTKGMESYELHAASRPLLDLIDDLSTWYLRRSRDRFKSDDAADKKLALGTTKYVLLETAKLLAPFMPFFAESVYAKVGGEAGLESVHLENWPQVSAVDEDMLSFMKNVRDLVTLGLEARSASSVKVRQPLASVVFNINPFASNAEHEKTAIALIADEVNVKEVKFVPGGKDPVVLDTVLTPELKREGQVRELLRSVQDLRKQAGLNVEDRATLYFGGDAENEVFIKDAAPELLKVAGITQVERKDGMEVPLMVARN